MLEVDEEDEDDVVEADDGAVDGDDVDDGALSDDVLVEPVPEAALFDDRESLR